MSLYISSPDVPAFHQKNYRKPRPLRFYDFRPNRRSVTPIPIVHGQSNPTYQEFINGDFTMDAGKLTA